MCKRSMLEEPSKAHNTGSQALLTQEPSKHYECTALIHYAPLTTSTYSKNYLHGTLDHSQSELGAYAQLPAHRRSNGSAC